MTPAAKQLTLVSSLALLSAIVVFLVLPRTSPGVVETFDREGGAIELLSALFYVVGCLFCLYRLFVVKTPHDRPYLYLWAVLCFLFFGEETSWLQHMIGYGTPEPIAEINVQHEFNLHNLLRSGSWHEALTSGHVDFRQFLDTTTLFRVGFFSYFLLGPILMHAGLFRGIGSKLGFPLPSVVFVVSLFATLSLSLLAYFLEPELRVELTEAREMYYALFIALYGFFFLGREGTSGQDARLGASP